MKPILFSVQNAHSTPFTRGIERHMEVNGQHFVQIDYDHRKTNILIQDGIAGYMCNGLQVHGKHATLRHFRYEKHVYNNLFNNLAKELKRFFELVKLPIHSFDLFITRNGNWGFFEACNQFGCTTVPDGFVRKETGLLLSHIAKQLQIK